MSHQTPNTNNINNKISVLHDRLKPSRFHQFRSLLRKFWLATLLLIVVLHGLLIYLPLTATSAMTHIMFALPSLYWALILTTVIYCVTQLIKTIMIGVVSPNSLGIFKWLRTTAFKRGWKSIYKRNITLDSSYLNSTFKTTHRGFLNINGLKCSTAVCFNNQKTHEWVIYTHGIGEDISFILDNKDYISELVKLHPSKNIAMTSRPNLDIVSSWFDYYHDKTPISTTVGLWEYINTIDNDASSFVLHGHSMGGAITAEATAIISDSNPDNKPIYRILDRTLTSVPKIVGARSISPLGWLFKMTGYDYATVSKEPQHWLFSLLWLFIGAIILSSCMVISTIICNYALSVYPVAIMPSGSAWLAIFSLSIIKPISLNLPILLTPQALAVLPLMMQQKLSYKPYYFIMSLIVISMVSLHLHPIVALSLITLYATIDTISYTQNFSQIKAISVPPTFMTYNKNDLSVLGKGRLDNTSAPKEFIHSEHNNNNPHQAHVAPWTDKNIEDYKNFTQPTY
ncbi:MAG: hypothetical protein ACON5A_01165 [Candidatus Comchoanobacterales bacterium]